MGSSGQQLVTHPARLREIGLSPTGIQGPLLELGCRRTETCSQTTALDVVFRQSCSQRPQLIVLAVRHDASIVVVGTPPLHLGAGQGQFRYGAMGASFGCLPSAFGATKCRFVGHSSEI